jgi:hypothetical protein
MSCKHLLGHAKRLGQQMDLSANDIERIVRVDKPPDEDWILYRRLA